MKNKKIKVEVNLYANLRQYSPSNQRSFRLDLAAGSTVRNLISKLQIPQHVKMVILINGRPAEADTLLSSEDNIVLYPPLEGG
jgi:molybdopterin converting factor small subunit